MKGNSKKELGSKPQSKKILTLAHGKILISVTRHSLLRLCIKVLKSSSKLRMPSGKKNTILVYEFWEKERRLKNQFISKFLAEMGCRSFMDTQTPPDFCLSKARENNNKLTKQNKLLKYCIVVASMSES